MTAPTLVQCLDSGPVRILTLNSPETRNSLSQAMIDALRVQVAEAAANPSIRVIVLAAEGPVFSAGHNLKEVTARRNAADQGEAEFRHLFRSCAELMLSIVKCPLPVIAQVQGMATAAGCQLAASCDLAVASESAKFATPGVNIGLFCSTPMVALSRNVAPKPAMEMLLTGDPIAAAEAQRIGLINRVVPDAELAAVTLELAMQIAAKPRATLRMGKEAFYRQLNMGVEDAYAYTLEVMTQNLLHSEAIEGIGAFVEKRKPDWSGD